ncbi:MAG: cysteine--tRNA ligase, partial [Candidatus Omnitrophica bacterium]|nr:cysteine--tRNA ligase [Candidatus Omnitrophota bacterium]
PKATENIPQMIAFIEKIIEKGYGYASGGDVYFSVDKFDGYGKLSNRNKKEIEENTVSEKDTLKRSPLDFALWKSAKENEPSWKSPWGPGRPGWHIECSVMSTGILGENFDIHGGGLDLIFPHHENEIAQSEAVTGKPFAKYWIHNGLLTVNGEKMSKSLGNFITISDFLDKYKDPDVLKISFLNSQYRSPVDYSGDKMESSRSAKERIMIFLDKARSAEWIRDADRKDVKNSFPEVRELYSKFDAAMDDDFNTPLALAVIFEAVKMGNEILSRETRAGKEGILVEQIQEFVESTSDILGLSLEKPVVDEEISKGIDSMVAEREKARREKNYKRSDEIRDELLKMEIVIEDTPEGPIWRKR